jgi:hypothetical protein
MLSRFLPRTGIRACRMPGDTGYAAAVAARLGSPLGKVRPDVFHGFAERHGHYRGTNTASNRQQRPGSSTGTKKLGLAGWQGNGILVWNSGTPFSITDNFTGFGNSLFNGIGGGPTRPNQIANAGLPNPSNAEFFNNNAFEVALLGTIGDSGRITLYGPHFRYFTFSIFKDFPVTERINLQFRTEISNLTNTPGYFIPNNQNDHGTTNQVPTADQIAAGAVSPAFGQVVVTSPNYTPREIQFALKLLFQGPPPC